MSFRLALARLSTVETESAPAGVLDTINTDFADGAIDKDKVAGVTYTVPVTTSGSDVNITLTDNLGTPTTDLVKLVAGTNIALTVGGTNSDEITIASTNFADVRIYSTTALRNAADTVAWHIGDVAIVDTGSAVTSYYYDGSTNGNNHTGITVDADWSVLHSPASSLTGAQIITAINAAAGAGTIDTGKLNAAVVLTSENLDSVADVTYGTLADNDMLLYDTTNSRWDNVTPNFPTTAPSTPSSGETADYIVQIDDAGALTYEEPTYPVAVSFVQDGAPSSPSQGDLWYYTGGDSDTYGNTPRLFVYYTSGSNSAWIAASPSPEVPNAPAAGDANTNYVLRVASANGAVTWAAETEAAGSLDKQTGITAITATDIAAMAPGTFAITRFGTVTGSSAPVQQLTAVATHHLLTYNGLVMIEGLDYSVNYSTNVITVGSAALGAFVLNGQLALTNTV